MKVLSRVLVALLLTALLAPLAVSAQDNTTVTTAFAEGEPANLDPQQTNTIDQFQVLYNVCEGIVGYDPKTLAPAPRLATSWDISADGTVYTFHLRTGVKFFNGREFTADDVKYSLERLGNPTTGTSYTNLMLANVKGFAEMQAKDNPASELSGVKVIDPATVEITLTAPTASFLNQLALPGGMIVAKEATSNADFSSNPVCTGPFKVASWDRQQQLTLEANPDYWGTAPAVKKAIIKVLPQQSQQVIEYQGGNLDLAWVSEADLPTIKADADLSKQVLAIPLLGTWHLRVNLNDPVVGKVEVRKAFAMAIDRQAIVDTILQGQGSPAVTLTAPGMNGYDPKLDPFPHDIAAAKALLAKAGYPDGVDITVRTQQVETENRVLAAIQQQVAEAGIRLKVNSTESGVYTQDRNTCNLQLGSIGWTNDYPDADDILFLVSNTTGARAKCGYSSSQNDAVKQVTDLLAQGSKMPLGAERDALYAQADAIAMDNVLVVPIYHPTRSVLVNPRLGGITVDADSIVRYDLMTLAS